MIRWLALGALLAASPAPAMAAQRCPPNSHAAAVAVPGNLRTAQCFCDRGYVSVGGVCLPAAKRPPQRERPTEPGGQLVSPQR